MTNKFVNIIILNNESSMAKNLYYSISNGNRSLVWQEKQTSLFTSAYEEKSKQGY